MRKKEILKAYITEEKIMQDLYYLMMYGTV